MRESMGVPNSIRSTFCRQLFCCLAAAAILTGQLNSVRADDNLGDFATGIQLDIAPIGNLFYQLECLAERLRCSQQAYRDLWDEIGFGSDEDLLALRQFATTLDIYDTRAQLGTRADSNSESSFGPEIVDLGPLTSESISILNRIQIAAYGSSTLDMFSERLGLLMHSADVGEVTFALTHFLARFEEWWGGGPSEQLAEFRHELRVALDRQGLEFIPAVAKLYGVDIESRPLPVVVHLMARPLNESPINGRMFENHAVIEVLQNEVAEQRIGVLVHEIAHFFFGSAPLILHRQRLDGALRAGDSRASAALGIMNEAIATAIGNGIVEEKIRGEDFQKYFEGERSFYDEPQIDAAAKAIFPLVREYIDETRPMDERFINQYFKLVLTGLGAGLDTLRARLRVSAYVSPDDFLAAGIKALPQRLGISSLYGSTLSHGDQLAESVLMRHPYLNGIVLARTDDPTQFTSLVPPIDWLEMLFVAGSNACTWRRKSGATIYVVLTDEDTLGTDDLIVLLEQALPCEPVDFPKS